MQTFEAAEAGEGFLRVLDEVRQGQTVLIEVDGRTVARLSPTAGLSSDAEAEQQRVDEAMASIREIRRRTQHISVEEILSARDEGRR